MPFITVYETTVEKLSPPTAVAGVAAVLANVTRTIQVDISSGDRLELEAPRIEVLWGVTVADKLASLDAEQADADAAAAAKAVEVATLKAELSKDVAEVTP